MDAFSFIVCFLLFQVTAVLGEQYDVTVITDPPSGPFLIENQINLTCHVHPMPPEPVTYSWHAVKDANGPTTLSSQKTTLYTPYYLDLHFSWFFCKVFSNGSPIGVGRRLVEIHGFVFSVEPLYRTIVLGYTIQLRVNISDDYRASYIRTLTWYHNEAELQASSRITVLNSGREIIIHNAVHADAGSYRVEITSLQVSGSLDSVCDSLWLPWLKNHAVHAPVTFTLKVLNESSSSCECYYTAHQKKLPLHHYPPVTGAFSSLLTITHDTNLTSSWTFNITVGVITSDYVSSVLSVNGSRLTSISKFNLSQTIIQPNILTQVIKFLYNSSDEGFYIQQLHISDPYHLYCALRDQGYRCFDHYHYTELYINLRSVSLVAFPFILTTYKSPSQVNISISSKVAAAGFMQLDCTAVGGVPDSHNIILFHTNQQIAARLGHKLQTYIASSSFGEFICVVESLHSTKRASLLLQEKASFQFLLAKNKQKMCMQWKVDATFYEDIRNLFKTVCDCRVDLEDVRVDCSMTGNIGMLLSGKVIYSNSEGNITASTLIDILQVWLLTSADPVIMIKHQQLKLIAQCPVELNSETAEACLNLKLMIPESIESSIIGGSFIGGVVAGILTCIIIAVLCIGLSCVLKLRADISMRRAGSTSESTSPTVKEEEVGTNQAYKTVEMCYLSASRRRPQANVLGPQENITGELVYENQQHLHAYT